jgi:hypothetical protein
MKNSLPVFFHVGFHKTGTTFLQRNLFSRHPDLELRNTQLFFLEDKLFCKGEDYYREMFHGNAPGKRLMESSESFSGHMFGLGEYETVGLRIREICPGAKVLLMIRNQIGMVESLYKQYIKERGILDFEGFLGSSKGEGVLSKVRYLDQVRFYKDTFGENLMIAAYEDLAGNLKGFLETLYAFIGVKEFSPDRRRQNRGATVFIGNLYRILNRWCDDSPFLNKHRRKVRYALDFADYRLVRHLDKRKYMTPEARKKIFDMYKESNEILSGWTGIDLAGYGYPYPS